MPPIAPGSTIGILGGGQLGRMTAMAARTLGYNVHVLDPDANCAASPVADRVIAAPFDDADAAADLARGCDVVTLEIEHLGVDALAAAERHAPVRPSADILAMVQDRSAQKRWLAANGYPIGAYREIRRASDLEAAARELGPLFVKASRGGYDGRSQARVARARGRRRRVDGARRAAFGCRTGARPPGRASASWSRGGRRARFARTRRRSIITSGRCSRGRSFPRRCPTASRAEADEIARGIAENLALEGILAVEMFLLANGTLLVNEFAPRPHNSYHETEVACSTSQFEQIVRAVCDLPLGDPTVLRPGAIFNLFGELWEHGAPPFESALSKPGVRLHLYGKRGARVGRKMGHLVRCWQQSGGRARARPRRRRRRRRGCVRFAHSLA